MFYGSQISDHIAETPEGFLICYDAPLCRTATKVPQRYKGTELGLRTNDLVEVYREPEEVLSNRFIASLNGKPITDAHPSQFLNSENAKWHQKGHVHNVKPGPRLPDGEQTIVGDLVITDEALIQKIKSGVRELSVGYNCEYRENGDGTFTQKNLAANHVAVVESGRAGAHVRILDAQKAPEQDFVDMARQYHGKNINEVAAQHKEELEERLRQSSVSREMLAAAEPHSFADLADELNERFNHGEDSIMKKDDLLELKDFIKKTVRAAVKDAVAEHPNNFEIDSFTSAFTVGEHPAVEKLRKLRPYIEKTGNVAMIHLFNNAMQSAKRMSGNLVPVADTSGSSRESKQADTKWEQSVRARRSELLGGENEKPQLKKRAADSTSRTDDEDWGRQITQFGQELRERQQPPKKK
jgi:hypothetical protein